MGVVYIVEGVAGAGKDTLVNQLITALDPSIRPVSIWTEAAALASWHHYYLPGIDELRLSLTEGIVRHVAATLESQPSTVFVFNRLHVSHAVWRAEKQNNTAALQQRHNALVARLRTLPVRILHPVLTGAEAAARTQHAERREIAWDQFLARRAADMGRQSVGELYLAQQQQMQHVMEQDGIGYHPMAVRHDQPIDFAGLLPPPGA